MDFEFSDNFLKKDNSEKFLAFGLNRKMDESTVFHYLKRFSDETFMKVIKKRLTDDELKEIFNMISSLIKKHLTKDEYHDLFLRD